MPVGSFVVRRFRHHPETETGLDCPAKKLHFEALTDFPVNTARKTALPQERFSLLLLEPHSQSAAFQTLTDNVSTGRTTSGSVRPSQISHARRNMSHVDRAISRNAVCDASRRQAAPLSSFQRPPSIGGLSESDFRVRIQKIPLPNTHRLSPDGRYHLYRPPHCGIISHISFSQAVSRLSWLSFSPSEFVPHFHGRFCRNAEPCHRLDASCRQENNSPREPTLTEDEHSARPCVRDGRRNAFSASVPRDGTHMIKQDAKYPRPPPMDFHQIRHDGL